MNSTKPQYAEHSVRSPNFHLNMSDLLNKQVQEHSPKAEASDATVNPNPPAKLDDHGPRNIAEKIKKWRRKKRKNGSFWMV